MNEYDSLRMLRMLEHAGYQKANSYLTASVIILNTCSVRKKAEDKVYSELGRINGLKKSNPALLIGVGGCLGQQEGKDLTKRYPYVDFVFGTKSLPRLPDIINQASQKKHVAHTEMIEDANLYPHRSYDPPDGAVSAFLAIMHGCNNYCAYCIVPYVRGAECSRNPEDIITEAQHLVDSGVREITLLGQNVNSYGQTLHPAMNFPELLGELAGISGLERIRFTTSHPKDLSAELITAFADIDKICEHIHLPIQAGSNIILKEMNRNYTRESYLGHIDHLRETIPQISITSDIIVGFPGETEDDFLQTVSLIKDIRFDDLFIFHYTDRPGTRASSFEKKVPYNIKIERLIELNRIQRSISLEKNSQYLDTVQMVLFEGLSKRGDGYQAGRTRTNKVVNCRSTEDLLGKTRPARIQKAHVHSLSADLAE